MIDKKRPKTLLCQSRYCLQKMKTTCLGDNSCQALSPSCFRSKIRATAPPSVVPVAKEGKPRDRAMRHDTKWWPTGVTFCTIQPPGLLFWLFFYLYTFIVIYTYLHSNLAGAKWSKVSTQSKPSLKFKHCQVKLQFLSPCTHYTNYFLCDKIQDFMHMSRAM